MSAKKMKKAATKKTMSTVINNTKKVAKKVNGFALKTTEEVVSESLNIVEQWQGVTAKAIQEGLKLAANQQDIFFDTLDTFKKHFARGTKRAKKLFA